MILFQSAAFVHKRKSRHIYRGFHRAVLRLINIGFDIPSMFMETIASKVQAQPPGWEVARASRGFGLVL